MYGFNDRAFGGGYGNAPKVTSFISTMLPILVTIGAGITTYFLTQDSNDDFIDTIIDRNQQQQQHDINEGDSIINDASFIFQDNMHGNDPNGKLDIVIESLEKQSQVLAKVVEDTNNNSNNSVVLAKSILDKPAWIQELYDLNKKTMSEVKKIKRIIKDKLNGSPDATAATAADSDSGSDDDDGEDAVDVPLTMEKKKEIIFNELTHMISESKKAGKAFAAVKEGCGSLIMYVNNLHENPTMPRYRRVSTNNTTFKSFVAPLPNHEKILSSIGFNLCGSVYEYTCIGTNTSNSGINVTGNESDINEILLEGLRLLKIVHTASSYDDCKLTTG